MTTGELSDDLPNLFVTAGFTFSIWGVIYILLALFTVYQLLIAFKRGGQEGRIIDGIGLYYFIASLTMGKSEKFFVLIPFSIYLGWITVATIANVTALLVDIGWNGFGIPDNVWTMVVLIVAALITLAALFSRQDVYYSLVIVWDKNPCLHFLSAVRIVDFSDIAEIYLSVFARFCLYSIHRSGFLFLVFVYIPQ